MLPRDHAERAPVAAPLHHQLADLIRDCESLPSSAKLRLEQVLLVVRRDLAVLELAALLNQGGILPRWPVAVDLANRLNRFETTVWPHIRAGRRAPKDRVEVLLYDVICDPSGPRSPRRLVNLIN